MAQNQFKVIAQYLATTQRKPENITFIGRNCMQFDGNVKYTFLQFVHEHKECNPCFITMDKRVYKELRRAGLPTALFPEHEAVEALASSSVVVVDDFHYRLQGMELFVKEAKIVQLWHGVGFKKIGYIEAESVMDKDAEHGAYLREMYSGYDAVISTSPFYTEHLFSTSFGAKDIWETGYPRNDVLLRKPLKDDFVGSNAQVYGQLRVLQKQSTTCVYVPTFRDDTMDPFQHGALNVDTLSAFLKKNGIELFIKMHLFSNQYSLEGVSNIHILPNQMDIYPMLSLFDCMITDYSSIYMDYLLLTRPVLFFPYDQQDYASKLRAFQFDYDTMTPGPKCWTQEELQNALTNVVQGEGGEDTWQKERERVRDMAFGRKDSMAAERVVAHVLELATTEKK